MVIKETPHRITPEARFFTVPDHPRQRQYEALRAFFVEGVPSAEAARRFGYQPGSFRILCWRFRHVSERDFFRDVPRGPQSQPRKDAVRARIIAMRKKNYSVYDIRDELERTGSDRLSATAIQEVLREQGFARLPRRLDESGPLPRVQPPTPSPTCAPSPSRTDRSLLGSADSSCCCRSSRDSISIALSMAAACRAAR